MKRTFKQALEHRRSIYALGNTVGVSENEIKEIIEHALLHVPSAFNSQSSRILLLMGDSHRRLWEIVKEVLREIVSPEQFANTKKKIESSFESGYGTVLFYEDMDVIERLQKQFPLYSENFPKWKHQTSAMHQLAVWAMLADAGLGASLQHYNPLIDTAVAKEWSVKESWQLIAQMPFGRVLVEAGDKESMPMEERLIVYR